MYNSLKTNLSQDQFNVRFSILRRLRFSIRKKLIIGNVYLPEWDYPPIGHISLETFKVFRYLAFYSYYWNVYIGSINKISKDLNLTPDIVYESIHHGVNFNLIYLFQNPNKESSPHNKIYRQSHIFVIPCLVRSTHLRKILGMTYPCLKKEQHVVEIGVPSAQEAIKQAEMRDLTFLQFYTSVLDQGQREALTYTSMVFYRAHYKNFDIEKQEWKDHFDLLPMMMYGLSQGRIGQDFFEDDGDIGELALDKTEFDYLKRLFSVPYVSQTQWSSLKKEFFARDIFILKSS